jgi:hypothetical protein
MVLVTMHTLCVRYGGCLSDGGHHCTGKIPTKRSKQIVHGMNHVI